MKDKLERILDYLTGQVLKKIPTADPKLVKQLVQKKLEDDHESHLH